MTDQTALTNFNSGLCEFLNVSPTPFHAVSAMAEHLVQHGFIQLHEVDSWGELSIGRYFVTRNDSSIIAFNLPASELAETGFHMMGAHTDSPCLKVKPQPEKTNNSLWQLGVEVYGGALLNPWFDRDLSMAGRVSYLDSNKKIKHTLIDFNKAVASIPSLAIHLDRDANKNRTVNPQQHLPPIVMQVTDEEQVDFRRLLLDHVIKQQPKLDIDKVLDYEISLYDTQKAAVIGLNDDFISSARLDNLLSCYIGLQALTNSDDLTQAGLLVCSDHEEVGSVSSSGASGSFLESVLLRLCPDIEQQHRMLQRSMMISADNAHAIHPNYSDKHDAEHGPKLNHGPVIKTNANQRYATNSETSAYFRHLCERHDVSVQDFVVRTDMGCGSTIGPITSSQLGIKTLDIGVPTYAMHSIRELAGSKDAYMLNQVITQFFKNS
ncbi:M18 family aminopeptidase [Methylophaga sp. 42_25_T18]|nr:M18 family aminopeptidase [Methylophaga sp. 42_25_T18]OUR87738.1 M18 family aminopeptidase [Methylophaga sp. 42_8_T64]